METDAPGIADPDLSSTLPEKLPVAWPRAAGANVIARTQTTRERSVPIDPVLAKEFIELKQFATSKVLFIFKPLSDEVALHRLRLAGARSPIVLLCVLTAL
jgi:hypothetical protein